MRFTKTLSKDQNTLHKAFMHIDKQSDTHKLKKNTYNYNNKLQIPKFLLLLSVQCL